MEAPLVEVTLQCQFDAVDYSADRLEYFYRLISDVLPNSVLPEKPHIAQYFALDGHEALLLSSNEFEIRNKSGVSFPRLRSRWSRILHSFLDVFRVASLNRFSLAYYNEIPLQDLRSFRDHLNILIEMPESLRERIEFFRSEFTYKYDFGEIKVWLQPDWSDMLDNYYIQLHLESRYPGIIPREQVLPALQQLHEGIKEVFHQVLSAQYIRQLPQ